MREERLGQREKEYNETGKLSFTKGVTPGAQSALFNRLTAEPRPPIGANSPWNLHINRRYRFLVEYMNSTSYQKPKLAEGS